MIEKVTVSGLNTLDNINEYLVTNLDTGIKHLIHQVAVWIKTLDVTLNISNLDTSPVVILKDVVDFFLA